ncbi:spermidine acetyltransferase [Clostridium botulinum]|uniref:spermidine acetyltransferase n=1 Tax=Clostridium botulinum TaxID=1491 RepID=UPI001375BEF9|nr:spermidine acetyltransferase [Clostridium botulinum]NCI20662.1 spermidine acetyltransferase [Clostridium botulinum]NCI35370.1 spermidine acetyltransferase [Clostridium botulinum]NCI72037.1 spermidine acetyltransferase [Clostridium botulinum]NDI38151.1 spermidine acetyltransferase [Clostridium botulinum]
MIRLEFIRKKNKNKQSFFNTKVAKSTLSQEEYEEGREIFLRFVKPINEKSLYNYFKECEAVRS